MTIAASPLEATHPTVTEVLVARGISHRGHGIPILSEASLTIHLGEAVLLWGQNGAGKSTLLRILAGIERPSAGVVRVFDGSTLVEPRRVGRRIGYVPQDPKFDPELSVEEALAFAAQCAGVSAGEARGIVSSMLQLFDLVELRDRSPEQLSAGERRRLAFARVLVSDPDVLLIDEPMAELDSPTQSALLEMLFELKTMGKTCVVASHTPWPFLDWADVVARLVDGQLRVDSVDQLCARDAGVRNARISVLGDARAAASQVAPPATVVEVLHDELSAGMSTLRVELPDEPSLVAELVRKLVTGGVAVVEVCQEPPSLVGLA